MNGIISAYGEIMLRLAAEKNKGIADSNVFTACYGGTEANVLACMAAFGHSVKYITGLPLGALGDGACAHLTEFGIDTSDIVRRGDTLGIYFVQDGGGSRGSSVEYMRRHSEFTKLCEDDFDCDKVFDGVSLFHVSGISFALSKSSRDVAFMLMREARRRNIAVSFDFNYRAKLWSTDEAAEQFIKVLETGVDIILASDLDLSVFLKASAERVADKYGFKYLVLRNRKIIAPDRHSVGVKVYYKGEDGKTNVYSTPAVEFPVTEKIGGGDAFDGAILHGLTCGWKVERAVNFAVAAFAYKHTVPGDTFIGSAEDVKNYADAIGLGGLV